MRHEITIGLSKRVKMLQHKVRSLNMHRQPLDKPVPARNKTRNLLNGRNTAWPLKHGLRLRGGKLLTHT